MTRPEPAAAVRQMLSDLLKRKRWRAPQAALELGVSEIIVRRWLSGHTSIPLDAVIRIAELAEADLNELFGLKHQNASNHISLDHWVELKVVMTLKNILARGVGLDDLPGLKPLASVYTDTLAPEAAQLLDQILDDTSDVANHASSRRRRR